MSSISLREFMPIDEHGFAPWREPIRKIDEIDALDVMSRG
jgi:hypothetical protein